MKTLIIGIVLVILGFVLLFLVKGIKETSEEAYKYFILVLAPAILFLAGLFIYNIFRAPYLIYLEEIGKAQVKIVEAQSSRKATEDKMKIVQERNTSLQNDLAALPKTRNNATASIPINQRSTQSQIDTFVESNRKLSSGDRDRLANALFDFSEVMDQANTAWGKANHLKVQEHSEGIVKDLEARKRKIADIRASAREYERLFAQQREKWKYYANQINFIFGDNPDNNALILRNAVDEYAAHLDAVLATNNNNEGEIKKLLWVEDIRYDEAIRNFALWNQYCARQLAQVKNSLAN
jgi:hypothetical protein